FLVFLCIALEIPIVETKEETFQRKELTIDEVSSYGITQREFEVILLIKRGLTNKEIASELSISVNTVNNHIANIFDKTDVRSRIDLLNLLQEAKW
ncbi:MAG: response regulator transcription factor, partial [Spirochaetales bacterium]|nr:response regulator transcription factor [Spirochaetales bacterium]